jgi:hypothetical protein
VVGGTLVSDVRYYRVSPKFWSRAEQRGWDDDTRLLALYLLTCPHRTTEGMYRLPLKYAQADLEWSPQRLGERLQGLVDDGFCDYDHDAGVVLILGALKYQACANPNMAQAAVKRLAELPETPLRATFQQLAERFDQQLTKLLPEGFGEPQALPQAPAQPPSPGEPRPDDRDDAEETFEQFWAIYPERDGRKRGKSNALIEWRKLTLEERRRAYIGAKHLTQAGEMPKDAERFLRRPKGGKGDFPFDDYQEKPKPAAKVSRLDERRNPRTGEAVPPSYGSPEWDARQEEMRRREEAILGGEV